MVQWNTRVTRRFRLYCIPYARVSHQHYLILARYRSGCRATSAQQSAMLQFCDAFLSLSLSVCFSHREDNNSIRRRHRRNDKHMMRMIPQSICIPAHMFHCLHLQTQTHTTHTGRTNEEKQSVFLSVYPHSTHSFTYHRSLPPANHLMHNENDVAKAEA